MLSDPLTGTFTTQALSGVTAPKWQSGDAVTISLDSDTQISTVTWTATGCCGRDVLWWNMVRERSLDGVPNIPNPTRLTLDHSVTSITVPAQTADWVVTVRIHNAGGRSGLRYSVATASALTNVPVLPGEIRVDSKSPTAFKISWLSERRDLHLRIQTITMRYRVSSTLAVMRCTVRMSFL